MKTGIVSLTVILAVVLLLLPSRLEAKGKPKPPPAPAATATGTFEALGAVTQVQPVAFERTALRKASGSYASTLDAWVSTDLNGLLISYFKDPQVCVDLEEIAEIVSAGRFHFRWDGVCEEGESGSCTASVRFAFEDSQGRTVRFYCIQDENFEPGIIVDGDPFQGGDTERISCMSLTARAFNGKKLIGECLWSAGSSFEVTNP